MADRKMIYLDDVIDAFDCSISGVPFHSVKYVSEYADKMISRISALPSAQPEHLTDEDFETIRIHLNAYKEQLCNQHRWEEAEDYQRIIDRFKAFASAEPEIIHCKDCIYYDPEHVEKNGVRYEYSDMPKDAFDTLGTGLVTSKYGVNVGGRCCRDYNVGYPEDKRVFVSEQNYCGRGERKS